MTDDLTAAVERLYGQLEFCGATAPLRGAASFSIAACR